MKSMGGSIYHTQQDFECANYEQKVIDGDYVSDIKT